MSIVIVVPPISIDPVWGIVRPCYRKSGLLHFRIEEGVGQNGIWYVFAKNRKK
jgi:hypothetical protein